MDERSAATGAIAICCILNGDSLSEEDDKDDDKDDCKDDDKGDDKEDDKGDDREFILATGDSTTSGGGGGGGIGISLFSNA